MPIGTTKKIEESNASQIFTPKVISNVCAQKKGKKIIPNAMFPKLIPKYGYPPSHLAVNINRKIVT